MALSQERSRAEVLQSTSDDPSEITANSNGTNAERPVVADLANLDLALQQICAEPKRSTGEMTASTTSVTSVVPTATTSSSEVASMAASRESLGRSRFKVDRVDKLTSVATLTDAQQQPTPNVSEP